MKNVCYAILFVGLMIGASCVDAVSPVVKLFKEHLEREISLEGFKKVYKGQDSLSYDDFRKRYPFLYVNYIDEECASCVVKIREWYKNSQSLPVYDKLAYVFVFRGEDYQKFLKHRVGKCPVTPFYFLCSKDFTYVINNKNIDRQIIDGGFLLDEKNRIKVIGSPLKSVPLMDLIGKKIYEEDDKEAIR